MAKIVLAGEPGEPTAILEAELAGEGHLVVTGTTGQEAYEITLREKPDAVFLAARMPVFDGLTTCRMLRDDPDIPVDLPVFLVANRDIDPKILERAEVTELFHARHEAAELREMLARHMGKAMWL